MKRILIPLLAAVVVFLLVVMVLNWRHGGPDEYPGGSLTPVPSDPSGENELARLIPSELTHLCPTCGECVHPVEVVESHRTLRIRDHHRWFQLFKAADRTYYFGDLIALASCVNIASARDPGGDWRISARLGPARHPKSAPHECGPLPHSFTATYELVVSPTPLAESAAGQAPARSTQVLSFQYGKPPNPSILYFGWRRLGDPREDPPTPCDCGKP
jgi:hypothetical protein